MSVAETLKAQLEADQMGGRSLTEIAKASSIPQPVLCRFANGTRSLRLETVEKLCTFYGFELRRTM